MNKIKMGTMRPSWEDGNAKTITFSVTEECNLACKYCYMYGKNSHNKMNFETAKKAIDYILLNRELFNEKAVIWEFVGGEPFLEIDLIDKICDYIKQQAYVLNHPWFNKYRFSFSTNGLLYNSPKVQKYIMKNKNHLSIGISVDGNKIKHDLQRVKLDGTGSYDDVMKNVPKWLEQFPENGTKATFSHDDLPYLKDSIISLWKKGIKFVSANVVFENVWQDGDDIIYEKQLKELADYILEHNLWEDYSVRFFDPYIGFPLEKEEIESNYCGAGKMLAIDYSGNFFPCVRFLDFTLENQEGLCIGDVKNGINTDKIRPFHYLTLENQSSKECIECEVASGCAWCTGYNYDISERGTIFNRAINNCQMHKANVRANKYFWDEFEKRTAIDSPRKLEEQKRKNSYNKFSKYIYFITSDDITPHCNYTNWNKTNNIMSEEVLKAGVEFCEYNNFIPVFLGNAPLGLKDNINLVSNNSIDGSKKQIVIFDNDVQKSKNRIENTILLIKKYNLNKISKLVQDLYKYTNRINLILQDIEEWNEQELNTYEIQLKEIKKFIVSTYQAKKPLEINVLTDMIYLDEMCGCEAGKKSFALAPNGKLYVCPAFYFNNSQDSIGDLENGINMYKIEDEFLCSKCDVYHCKRCKYLNQKLTHEIHIPSKIQCNVSYIERNVARELQKVLLKQNLIDSNKIIKEVDFSDPLELELQNKGVRLC